MIRLSKSVLAVGGVVLAADLITVMNPKAVHAVAAALVQVTNTAANPAVTQSITQQASQTVRLRCSANGAANDCGATPPVGQEIVAAYVVPPNQSLIITAMDISFFDCAAGVGVGAIILTDSVNDSNPAGSVRWDWALPVSAANFNGQPITNHLTFPLGAGPLIHSGDTVRVTALSCPSAQMAVYGYLTAN